MGKVILCTGNRAKKPYCFWSVGVRIYSMEELCYFIYNNIDSVSEEIFSEDLIVFIRDELGLAERAEFLDNLRKNRAEFKDMVVSILCTTDYYDEKQIKDLLKEIDILGKLKQVQRKKRKADEVMKHGKTKSALKEYKNILNSKEIAELTPEECGDILHNIAVTNAKAGAFSAAAEGFLEAYERNGRKESLKQYLYALKLWGQAELFEREKKMHVTNHELFDEIEAELYRADESVEAAPAYINFRKLKQLKEQGKVIEYNRQLELILEGLKQKYRGECI